VISKRRMHVWWLLLLLIPTLAHAVQVRATLDRSTAQLGDTVTLNLRISGGHGTDAAPDLSALAGDFDILGTSQNSSLSVVNGAATSALTYGVALRPKHVGVLQIPAISVAGGRTTPLQLEVTAADPAAAATPNKDVFLEAQVEPGHGYVGQQLSYVVRLFVATDISNGSLEQPQINGVELSQVGGDLRYDSQRGGRQYRVIERRYALIAQHPGELQIPALSFQGVAADPNDPDAFFGGGSTVSASAPALSVDIVAPPANWGTSAWLPARQLTLTLDGWPSPQQPLRVGQPLNLVMTLQATGLPQEALPALSLPPLDGATVYPDKPVTGNREDGQWLVGHRQQAFAIVPERVGTLTIPATTVKWWNVLSDRMELAQIPAHSVNVLPAAGGAVPAAPATAALAPGAATAVAGSAAKISATSAWRWLGLGSIGLWLLSVLGWLLWRRRRLATAQAPRPEQASSRQQRLAFLEAARGSDSAAQLRCLMAWARAERPAIRHAGDLLQALADPQQRAAITTLQQRQYASAPPTDNLLLTDLFARGFSWRPLDHDKGDGDLPPLYSFNLHPD
jgi:hypothetical protein